MPNFSLRIHIALKITSQAQPDASPVGLRLVGLLPCAVWTPKVPKPRIAGQARTSTTPYPIVTATAGSTIIPVGSIAATATRSDSLCRCAHSSTQPITVQARSTPSVSSIAQPPIAPLRQIRPTRAVATATAVQPITAANTSSPMLLVPFAMPGFMPVQGQQPAVMPPPHATHMQPSSSMTSYHQPAAAPPPPIQHVNSGGGVGAGTLLLTTSSFNKGNSKVSSFTITHLPCLL